MLVVDAQENEVGQLCAKDRQLTLPARMQERQGGTKEPIGRGDKRRGQVGDVGLVEDTHHDKSIDGDQKQGCHQGARRQRREERGDPHSRSQAGEHDTAHQTRLGDMSKPVFHNNFSLR